MTGNGYSLVGVLLVCHIQDKLEGKNNREYDEKHVKRIKSSASTSLHIGLLVTGDAAGRENGMAVHYEAVKLVGHF